MDNAKPVANKTSPMAEVDEQTKPEAEAQVSGSKPSPVGIGEGSSQKDEALNSQDEQKHDPEDASFADAPKATGEASKTNSETAALVQSMEEPALSDVVSPQVTIEAIPVQPIDEAMATQLKEEGEEAMLAELEEAMEMQYLPVQPINYQTDLPGLTQRQIVFVDQGDWNVPLRRLNVEEIPQENYDTPIYKMGRKSRPGNIMLEVPNAKIKSSSNEVQTDDAVFQEIEEEEKAQDKVNEISDKISADELGDKVSEENTSKIISLGDIIKKSWQKKFPKKESEGDFEMKDEDELAEQDTTDYNLYTGMFEDGVRRVDFVLVLHASENLMAETGKLAFLTGLVEAGVQLESEAGVLKEHQHIQFVKLHAPDGVLDKHAGIFGVRRYFRNNHESFLDHKMVLMERFKLEQERDWLKAVRSHYPLPLQLSSQDRSYVVYLMMRYLKRYGLERLLQKRTILDAYALHDGPYYCSPRQKFDTFNCRQVLFLNWAGRHNVFKYQPLHMIHEYFGSKVAFYFAFYGFYNMALVFISIWGVFMMIVYSFKDYDYLNYIREYICHIRDVKVSSHTVVTEALKIVPNSAVCGECEGASSVTVCPITALQDHCFDLKLMQYFDSPYIMVYSFGLDFWALLFLAYWRRTECYYKWMWEETRPQRQMIKFSDIPNRDMKFYNWQWPFPRGLLKPLGRAAMNLMLGTVSVAILGAVLFVTILYVHIEFTSPLAATIVKVVRKAAGRAPFKDIVPPKINKLKEYALLAVVALMTVFCLHSAEKILHTVSTLLTREEGHRTFQKRERSLILKYISFSLVYGTCLIMYFAYVKGLFYSTPIAIWTVDINLTLPWDNYSVSLKKVSDYWRNITLRALTANCGPFSCLRQATVVFVVTVIFRAAATFINTLMSNLPPAGRRRRAKDDVEEEALPTCEREYMMRHVSHHDVACDINAIVSQFAILLLFAPLFPIAPLFVLIFNIYDLRNKAKFYVIRCRRVLLFRSGGLGYWNHVLKLIVYAAPLFHAFIIARTEIFKRWVFYYNQAANITKGVERKFRAYMTQVNIEIYRISQTNSEYGSINNRRVSTDSASFNPTLFIAASNRWVGVYQCRVDGFFELTKKKTGYGWPDHRNFMSENISMAAPTADHYHNKFLRVLFVLIYVHVMSLLALLVWQCVGACAAPLARYRQRQRVLQRLHHTRLNWIQRLHDTQ